MGGIKMKAVQIDEYGGPEVLKYRDVAEPVPGQGEAVVRIQASGVNFTDIYTRKGEGKAKLVPYFPHSIGVEGAGIVQEVGPDVTNVAVGDEVVYGIQLGSYTEQAVVPAGRLIKRPKGLSAKAAASVYLQGLTAHYLCYSTYAVKQGDRVFIHGGAGGTGLVLTQMVKRLGGTVISSVSTEEKAEIAKQYGADHVVVYSRQEPVDAVMELTNGEGVHVVYDGIGKATFHKSIAMLAVRGHMVLFGAASGQPDPISVHEVLTPRSLTITRAGLTSYTRTRDELEQRSNDVLNWLSAGAIKVLVSEEYHLSEVQEAHRRLEGKSTIGKLLLLP